MPIDLPQVSRITDMDAVSDLEDTPTWIEEHCSPQPELAFRE